LTGRAVRFLDSLPTHWRKAVAGVRVAVWHARPGDASGMAGMYPDMDGEALRALLDAAGADVLVVGHTHLRFCLRLTDGRMVVNPGALLRAPAQPMEEATLYDPTTGRFAPAPAPGGGTFGVLELPSRRFSVHRAADGGEVEAERREVGGAPTRIRKRSRK
jgi:hypothetical protein